MTYSQARFRIVAYWLLAFVLRVGTAAILAVAPIKSLYTLTAQDCGPFHNLCSAFHGLIEYLAAVFPPFVWIWEALPYVAPAFWFLALLSPIGLCAGFFMLFSFFMSRERRELSEDLREARKQARVIIMNKKNNSQSIGDIQAGGNVNIEQIIGNNPEIRDRDNHFSKSPVGQIIIAVVGGVLTALLGKVLMVLLAKWMTG